MTEPLFVNNVTRMLDANGVPYKIQRYAYGESTHSATDVASALGLPPDQVYKTLITQPFGRARKPGAVILPGPEQLDLRKFAQAVGEKKIRMASRSEAETWTGMQSGGISPLALIQKPIGIYLDSRANDMAMIYVSAGERGAQVGLAVADLLRLTGARTIPIS